MWSPRPTTESRRSSSFRNSGYPASSCLDLRLPRMNGWDLRQHMLADPALARVPVVVMADDSAAADALLQVEDACQADAD